MRGTARHPWAEGVQVHPIALTIHRSLREAGRNAHRNRRYGHDGHENGPRALGREPDRGPGHGQHRDHVPVHRRPITWAARTEEAGRPDESRGAARRTHAACYAMAFSNVLNKAGHPRARST
jgi:hypothetical protein